MSRSLPLEAEVPPDWSWRRSREFSLFSCSFAMESCSSCCSIPSLFRPCSCHSCVRVWSWRISHVSCFRISSTVDRSCELPASLCCGCASE